MARHYNPRVATANLLLMVDFSNQNYVNSSTLSVTSPYSNLTLTAPGPTYVSIANGFATYTHAASANSTTKAAAGGYHISPDMSNVVGLRYNEFYYNDHTFEVWARINDPNPSNFDGTETNSFLLGVSITLPL